MRNEGETEIFLIVSQKFRARRYLNQGNKHPVYANERIELKPVREFSGVHLLRARVQLA